MEEKEEEVLRREGADRGPYAIPIPTSAWLSVPRGGKDRRIERGSPARYACAFDLEGEEGEKGREKDSPKEYES